MRVHERGEHSKRMGGVARGTNLLGVPVDHVRVAVDPFLGHGRVEIRVDEDVEDACRWVIS